MYEFSHDNFDYTESALLLNFFFLRNIHSKDFLRTINSLNAKMIEVNKVYKETEFI